MALNTVVLMGRITRDPELRHTQSGTAVTSFTLAVDRSYTDRSGDRQTDFFDIVAWRNTAEFIAKYFNKGDMIAIEGVLTTRDYTDKEGKTRKVVEVTVNTASFCGNKKNAEPHKAERGIDAEFAEIEDDEDLPF